ncbi:MAG TPA: polymer-forming cytoskeletal protein [Anaeromyxobacteraceae bacterium]|nr:polymer-forming cytoskeletal protein [Anaeromyxobacteraceae bacterium]
MATLKRDELPTTLGGTSDLLLGAGAEFEGKLTFKGTVRIDAVFKGSIFTDDVLVVGEHARIEAEITCGTIIVHGEVRGNIRAKNAVELHHPAKVRGDLFTPAISMEKGVLLHGSVKMENLERAAQQRPVTTPPPAP